MVISSKYLAIVFALVLFVSLASAGFNIGDEGYSIEKIYGKGDYIRGWVNMSFADAASDSLFEYSDDSVRLMDLLNENSDYDYTCNPLDCLTDYGASNENIIKNFNLDEGDSKIFGLKFTGNVVNVNSISFDVQSDAPPSCPNQLKIDFLDDESIEAQNNKTSVDVCSTKDYGCFDGSKSIEEYRLSTVPYCQKIELLESPGLLVGAWIKNVSGSSETLTMELYKNDGLSVGTCELPQTTSSGGEVSCEIDYVVTDKEDYYVCVYSSDGIEYEVRGNLNPSEGCGLYGIPSFSSNTPSAYEIFVQRKKFDSIGTLEITNSLPYGETLNVLVQDYLQERYGVDLDCTNECVVPIRFLSQENQAITIENLIVEYQKEGGLVIERKFYDLTGTPAIIDSNYQKLYLDNGNFSVPNNLGDYVFSLNFEGAEVFSEEISVEYIPIIEFVRPTVTASAYPTQFVVGIDSSSEITSYDWDFGDNGTARTSKNNTTHTYSSTGNYTLTIDVTDSEGLSASRTFQIKVGLPNEIINNTLKKMQNDVENVKTQILEQNLFSRSSLNSVLNIDFLEEELEDIETDYGVAGSEEEYNSLLTRLLNLNVAKSIARGKSASSISFFPEENNIDVDVLQIIGGGSIEAGKEDNYVDSILIWNHENIETKINFNEFSAEYESSLKPILRVFELTLEEVGDAGANSYLIIEDLDGLSFDKSYLEKEESGFVYINLDNFPITIKFFTTENVDFVNLPAFVSPPISRLSISDDITTEDEDDVPKWNVFVLIIVFLALAGLIIYIVLQQWYKKKYETHLFGNRTELYNMVTYVNNAKKRGLKRGEIASNLRRSGWSSEKVRYVMRKYVGKMTGMFEVPVSNILEKIKKKDESEKYSR